MAEETYTPWPHTAVGNNFSILRQLLQTPWGVRAKLGQRA